MKYCIDYSKKSLILDKIDEINLEYDTRKDIFLDFLLKHKDQRINICICNHRIYDIGNFIARGEIEEIYDIIQKHPDLQLYLRFPVYHSALDEVIDYCKEHNIPFYFNTYITTWDELRGYIDYGVSDVIVAEALAFSATDVGYYAHRRNVTVRMIPDIAQSSWHDSEPITKFFIRPEDVAAYEGVVDVLDLYGDGQRTNTTYKIYKEDEHWYGDLSEIILDLDESLDSRGLTKLFGMARKNCHKKCAGIDTCRVCFKAKELSDTMIENDLLLK